MSDVAVVNLAEQLMMGSGSMVSVLINNIRSGIVFENEQQKILLANAAFCDMFGIKETPGSLLGMDYGGGADQNKHLFENPDFYAYRIRQVLHQRAITHGDTLYMKDGRILERDYIPIIDKGQYRGHLWMYNDVTAKKNQERMIKIQVEKYRNIIANMNLGLMEVDNNDYIVSVNDIFCHISGYHQNELIGRKSVEILRSKVNENMIEKKNKLKEHGMIEVVQMPILDKFGDEHWWLMSDAPNYDEAGNLIGSIGIHMDISEQKQMERELEQSKKRAEDSSRAKETFLANMSHEIRTPMTGILGMANLLGKTTLDEQQRKFTKMITESTNNLLTIVNEVLDIEKIASGKLELEYIPFKLEEKVFTTLQSFQFKAEEKNINLLLNSSLEDDLVVVGDPYRLGQILNNLLGNALKFTHEGEITMNMNYRTAPDAKRLVIEFQVRDTGIGVKQEKLQDIFTPFTQASTDTTRKYGGTGLGLTICKNLVEMQGGSIYVASKIGEGTTFTFFVPYEKGDVSMLAGESKEIVNFKDLDGVKILVAEDVELNQFLIKHILEAWGCEVTLVANGREAVEKVKTQPFDVILMDIQMPEMDGITATKIIRTLYIVDKSVITKKIRTLNAKDKSAIPIIALTANALKGDGERYLDIGMNGYVTKPYTEEKLFQVISQVVQRNMTAVPKAELEADAPPVVVAAPAPPPVAEKYYDLSFVDTISKGDKEFARKIIVIFQETMPALLDELVKGAADEQAEVVARTAHKMKSNIDLLGINTLKEVIRKLEAIEAVTADAHAWADKVNVILREVFVQLKEIL